MKRKIHCGKCSKISTTILDLFLYKMLVIRAVIHKMLVRIANREGKQSDRDLHCLSRPFFGRQLVFNILECLLYVTL